MSINIKNISNITWYDWPEMRSIVKASTKEQLDNNFNVLDEKISAARRELDYYNVYRFVSSVADATEFAEKFSTIPNNTSLVVNTNFVYNGKKYSAGDLIIKSETGKEIQVSTKQNGMFFPYGYKIAEGLITLVYKIAKSYNDLTITSGTDSQGYTKISWEGEGEDKSANIPLPILDSGVVYNIISDINSGTEPIVVTNQDLLLDDSNNTIYPHAKLYDNSGEEFYYDGLIYIHGSYFDYTIPVGLKVVIR